MVLNRYNLQYLFNPLGSKSKKRLRTKFSCNFPATEDQIAKEIRDAEGRNRKYSKAKMERRYKELVDPRCCDYLTMPCSHKLGRKRKFGIIKNQQIWKEPFSRVSTKKQVCLAYYFLSESNLSTNQYSYLSWLP